MLISATNFFQIQCSCKLRMYEKVINAHHVIIRRQFRDRNADITSRAFQHFSFSIVCLHGSPTGSPFVTFSSVQRMSCVLAEAARHGIDPSTLTLLWLLTQPTNQRLLLTTTSDRTQLTFRCSLRTGLHNWTKVSDTSKPSDRLAVYEGCCWLVGP